VGVGVGGNILSWGRRRTSFFCIVLGIQVLAFHSQHKHCGMVQVVRNFKNSTPLNSLSMLQTRVMEEM
jgi:hypothetical protein